MLRADESGERWRRARPWHGRLRGALVQHLDDADLIGPAAGGGAGAGRATQQPPGSAGRPPPPTGARPGAGPRRPPRQGPARAAGRPRARAARTGAASRGGRGPGGATSAARARPTSGLNNALGLELGARAPERCRETAGEARRRRRARAEAQSARARRAGRDDALPAATASPLHGPTDGERFTHERPGVDDRPGPTSTRRRSPSPGRSRWRPWPQARSAPYDPGAVKGGGGGRTRSPAMSCGDRLLAVGLSASCAAESASDRERSAGRPPKASPSCPSTTYKPHGCKRSLGVEQHRWRRRRGGEEGGSRVQPLTGSADGRDQHGRRHRTVSERVGDPHLPGNVIPTGRCWEISRASAGSSTRRERNATIRAEFKSGRPSGRSRRGTLTVGSSPRTRSSSSAGRRRRVRHRSENDRVDLARRQHGTDVDFYLPYLGRGLRILVDGGYDPCRRRAGRPRRPRVQSSRASCKAPVAHATRRTR